MGSEILDLFLCGVKWELSDTPNARNAKNIHTKSTETGPKDIKTDVEKANSPTIIAPTQPIEKEIVIKTAQELAENATDWDSLVQIVYNFEHPLKAIAGKNLFPKKTGKESSLIIITDFPSSEDEDSGKLLSGAAGQLFDNMLSAIGISRDNVTLIPLCFWRAPGGRTPLPEEIEMCTPFVMRAIDITKPSAILTLGTTAANLIADVTLPAQHGQIIICGCTKCQNVQIVPIFHPNYILLKPDTKKIVWDALQKLLQILQNNV